MMRRAFETVAIDRLDRIGKTNEKMSKGIVDSHQEIIGMIIREFDKGSSNACVGIELTYGVIQSVGNVMY